MGALQTLHFNKIRSKICLTTVLFVLQHAHNWLVVELAAPKGPTTYWPVYHQYHV